MSIVLNVGFIPSIILIKYAKEKKIMDTHSNFSANLSEGEVISKKKFLFSGRKKVEVFEEATLRFKNLKVLSDVNVTLKGSNSCAVKIKVSGKMPFTGALLVNLYKIDAGDSSTLFIEIHLNKGSFSGCSSKELTADIAIPNKLLENLSVVTDSGDIFVEESVLFVNGLSVFTNAGYIECYAPFRTSFAATSESGDCDLFINARKHITVDFKTTSGNFLGVLSNVGMVQLCTSKTTGIIRNRHTDRLGPSADITISSVSGDIRIH